MYRFEIRGNNCVITDLENSEVLIDRPASALSLHIEAATGYVLIESIFRETSQSSVDPIKISETEDEAGTVFDVTTLRTWGQTHLGFNPGGSASSTTDPFVTASQLAVVQAQLDEAEIIARSDVLEPGETIAEAGTRFDAAGRRWETLNDNAVVPDPLTVAALEASADFGEPTVGHPFGDAQVSVRALDVFANREVIQQTGGDFGIYTNSCLLYTSPSPRDQRGSRMPSSA